MSWSWCSCHVVLTASPLPHCCPCVPLALQAQVAALNQQQQAANRPQTSAARFASQ